MNELRLEQFKALKEEYRQYLFYIQQLWKFKFITLGVVVSAALLNEKIIVNITPNSYIQTIATLGFALMPLICLAIDLKTLEIGLHVRLISDFIRDNYSEVREIHLWEKNVWDDKKGSNLRTKITIYSALGTSLGVIAICFIGCMKIMSGYSYLLLGYFAFLFLLFCISAYKLLPAIRKN